MPNHCYNELKVLGPEDAISKFKETARGFNPWNTANPEILCCAKFIPPPQIAIDDYDRIGYAWCIRRWDTKWGCYDVELSIDEPTELLYIFDSAWSPPSSVVIEMGRLFSELKFELYFEEPGDDFEGDLVIENGKVIKDETRKYKHFCDICDLKNSSVVYVDEFEENLCPDCLKKRREEKEKEVSKDGA